VRSEREVNEQAGLFDDFGDGDALQGTDVTLHRAAINAREADHLYAALLDDVNWQQEHIRIMGKTIPLPRLTAWYGDEGRHYTYSGITMPAAPWIEPLLRSRQAAQQVAGASFNSVLCNLYRSGADGLSWHSDDEPELGATPTIASVNFGAARRFLLRLRDDHASKVELLLDHGDVLVMRGNTQRVAEHSVPKTKRPVGQRINLTFRQIHV
jgi:alkylated DNA repair dioxygenase AlkB